MPLRRLMQSLYYPAVLGTVFVLFLSRLSLPKDTLTSLLVTENLFVLLMIFYFSVSFLVNETIDDTNYRLGAFFCDLSEIALIIISIIFLGMLSLDGSATTDWERFFYVLAPLPIIQQLWNYFTGQNDPKYWLISAIATGSLITTGAFVVNFSWTKYVEFVILLIIISTYLHMNVRKGNE